MFDSVLGAGLHPRHYHLINHLNTTEMAEQKTTVLKKRQVRGGKKKPASEKYALTAPVKEKVMTLALNLLQNHVVMKTEAKGAASLVSYEYPSSVVEAARGLFPAGKEYAFEIHASSTLATNGAGSISQTISWSPATTTFAEWSALAALFDEVKLAKTHIDITSAFGPTSSAIVTQIVVAPDFTTISGSTPSYTTLQRLAESEVIHCAWMANGGAPGRFTKTAKVPPRDWATTAVPAGASGMIAGCLGHWGFASNIVGTVSINYLFVAMRNLIKLRMRA